MRVVRWKEPAAVKRARNSAGGPWWPRGLATCIALTALVLLIRAVVPAISYQPHAPAWPLMILIAIACGVVAGFLLPWFTSVCPSEVLVSAKGINLNSFEGAKIAIRFWAWDRISRLSIERLAIHDKTFDSLVIYGEADEPIGAIGLAAKTPISDLEQIVAANGKSLNRAAV